MSKLKRLADIMKGLLAIGVIAGSIPFIVFPIIKYWVECFKLFF
tara:strand:- start:208 stop:339 length:132 start_codon:yes stop_codon:yes gene_type:complete